MFAIWWWPLWRGFWILDDITALEQFTPESGRPRRTCLRPAMRID